MPLDRGRNFWINYLEEKRKGRDGSSFRLEVSSWVAPLVLKTLPRPQEPSGEEKANSSSRRNKGGAEFIQSFLWIQPIIG